MRPEDFKLNTDYMSLATASNFSTTINIPGTTTTDYNVYTYSVDLSAPTVNKAYCEYAFCIDGTNWILDNDYGFYRGDYLCVLSIERTSSTSIRVRFSAVGLGSGSHTLSGFAVKIKEAAIVAPDMN